MTPLNLDDLDIPRTSPGPSRDPSAKGIRIPPGIAMQLIAWLVGLVLVYGAVNTRVSVLESKGMDNDRRLSSIESKIDQLLSRGQK